MQQRYKVVVAYDGSAYVGYQVQKNGRSIQAELNKALKKITKGLEIAVTGSSRTDSGVHANGQVVHFDVPFVIEEQSLLRAMNSILPSDILIKTVQRVPDTFHARYSVTGKRYVYRVDVAPFPDPFKRLYTLHHPYRFNVEKMNQALQDVIGTHDFTSFCSTKSDKDDKMRTIYRADVYYDETKQELVFTFEGNGFLYNMIRILVGTSLQIGDGLKDVHEMKRLLEVKERKQAGPTAPPQGLYLDEVFYD